VSTWQDLVTASLIGTERAEVPVTGIPGWPAGDTPAQPGRAGDTSGQAGPAASQDGLPRDPAGLLLDQAALLTAARRAGRTADDAESLAPADLDPRPAAGPAAGERLARILSGDHPDLLAEWLRAAAARGLRVPARVLPALLDRCRRAGAADPGLRRLVAEAGGTRARWLARLNPDWKWLADFDPDPATAAVDAGTGEEPGPRATSERRPGKDAWRLGDIAQRRGYLAALRAGDPGAARDLIAASWAAAGASERVMFLRVLADEPALVPDEPGLMPEDEPLLEAALDDRADDVHGWAGYLLATLPGSALGARMAGRALRSVAIRSGTQGSYLIVRPPAEYDPGLRRDGVAPRPAAGRTSLAEPTRLVLEIVARTPLRTWVDAFALAPPAIVALRSGNWAPVLFTGWSRAAIAQRDQQWMAALINEALSGRPPGTPSENEALSQLARRADPALGGPGAVPGPEPGCPAAVRNAITVLRFRYDMLKELDNDHSDG
jgi:hypothetical protein